MNTKNKRRKKKTQNNKKSKNRNSSNNDIQQTCMIPSVMAFFNKLTNFRVPSEMALAQLEARPVR